jgi:dihydrofolate synthase/folylpolyglutamate synthase
MDTSSKAYALDNRSSSAPAIEVPMTKYEELLRKIYFISNIKRGLLNITQLNEALHNPLERGQEDGQPNKISIIHVAGTNGKGSVCLKILKSLELAGYTVGLLISPHISSFRERMSINGTLITEEEVTTHLLHILQICERHDIQPTFFEITTALSFLYFSDPSKNVDAVVLETGLGGLLDATNIVQNPVLAVITSIGLEHTAILGNTVEEIAEHKAGIVKEGCPVLVGPNCPHETIRRVAKERLAEGYYTNDDVLGKENKREHERETAIGVDYDYVDYDEENSRTARAALMLLQKKYPQKFSLEKITPSIIQEGTAHRPCCRFEEIVMENSNSNSNGCTIILDIAHNPPAMKTLVAKLQATYPSITKRFVVGFSADKDIAEIGELLLSVVPDPSHIHLVEAVNLRAAKVEDIFLAVPRLRPQDGAATVAIDRSIAVQVKCAREIAQEKGEVLVVCGSVFLMSEARLALGIEEARDSENITKVAGQGLMKCKEKLEAAKSSNS